jgi:small subunit ribosomal protein S2
MSVPTITLEELFANGVHFGHQTRYWNPKMAPYIFGERQKVHIINLDKTLPMLKEAMQFLSEIVGKKGKVLFVGTKFAARDLIKEFATQCGMSYINYRWLGGMLTNYKTIRLSSKRLKNLDEQFEKQAFGNLTKKEVLMLSTRRAKLEKALGGIRTMHGLPDALFVLDVGHDKIAVQEARKLKIPVIGIVDTNHSPEGIDYVIPGNDDSAKSIKLYLSLAAQYIMQGKESQGLLLNEESSKDEFVEVDAEELAKYEKDTSETEASGEESVGKKKKRVNKKTAE